jgi:cytochrome c oxidase subunit 2
MTQPTGSQASVRHERTDRQHMLRIAVIWVVLSVVGMVLVYFVWGPHMPPGKGTPVASSQVTDNTVLLVVMTPFTVFILVYLAYALVAFRAVQGRNYGADD